MGKKKGENKVNHAADQKQKAAEILGNSLEDKKESLTIDQEEHQNKVESSRSKCIVLRIIGTVLIVGASILLCKTMSTMLQSGDLLTGYGTGGGFEIPIPILCISFFLIIGGILSWGESNK